MNQYVSDNVIGHVAEKLDGSNVAVTSKGVISSRRNILLNNPTEEELKKVKFSGVKLHNVAAMFESLRKMEESFNRYFPFLDVEAILYGELVQKGTATSTEDKYQYRSKGYQEGGYYIFGAGVAFGENLSKSQVEKAALHLENKGFSVIIQENEKVGRSHLILPMSDFLKRFLNEHKVINLIQHQQTTLSEAVEIYKDQLLSNKLEGIVINFGTEILKWKGLEESYPDQFMAEIEVLATDLIVKDVYNSIHLVAHKARQHWAELKSERATLFLLEKAYKSALTKIRSLDDRKCEEGKLKATEVGNFQEALELEMMKDSHCDTHFQEKLPAFIQSKLKSI